MTTFNIRTLNGLTLKIDCDRDEIVETLKRRIREKYGIRVALQKLIFAGKLLKNERTIADYNIRSRRSTIHLVIRLGEKIEYDHPDYEWEVRNFARILKKRKNGWDGSPEKKREEAESIFEVYIIPSGKFGPLSLILSFLDPLELLFSQVFVCRTFHDTSFHVLESKMIELRDTHYQVLFGRNSGISEPLFLKLIHLMKVDLGISLKDFRYYFEKPSHLVQVIEKEELRKGGNLLDKAILGGFEDSLRYLVEEENFEIKGDHFRLCRVEKDQHFRILEFLVNNTNLIDVSHSQILFSSLMKKGDERCWNIISSLLKLDNDGNIYSNLHIALSYIDGTRVPTEKFQKFFVNVPHPYSFLRQRLYIRQSIRNIEWEDLKGLIVMKKGDDSDDSELLQKYMEFFKKGEILSFLEERVEFFQFAFENNDKLIRKVYMPRIELYLACINKDLKRIQKIVNDVNLYDPSKDWHNCIGGRLSRSYGIDENDFHLEHFDLPVVKALLSSKKGVIKFRIKTYHHALEKEKFDICNFFIDQNLHLELGYKNPKRVKKIISMELEKKRLKEAMWMMKKIYIPFILPSLGFQDTEFLNGILEVAANVGMMEMCELCVELILKEKWLLVYRDIKNRFISVLETLMSLLGKLEEFHETIEHLTSEVIEKYLSKKEKGKGLSFDGIMKLILIMRICIKHNVKKFAQEIIMMEDWKNEYFVRCLLEKDRQLQVVGVDLNEMQKFVKESEFRGVGDQILVECVFGCNEKLDILNELFEVTWIAPKSSSSKSECEKKLICYNCLEKLVC